MQLLQASQAPPPPSPTIAHTIPKPPGMKIQISDPTDNPAISSSFPAKPNTQRSTNKNFFLAKLTDNVKNSEMTLDCQDFPCPYCDKTFPAKSNLEKHLPFHRLV